jgi:putative sterol carrier protein
LGFRITGDVERYWRLRVDPAGFSAAEEAPESENSAQPDIEVIAHEQTWRSLAEGALSPMAAMFTGQLRFRGDVVLASRVVRQLRGAGTAQSGKE